MQKSKSTKATTKRRVRAEDFDDESFRDFTGTPVDITTIANRHKLDDLDIQILRLLIEQPAITFTEIGSVVGMHRHNVRKRCQKPKFRSAYEDYNKGVFDKLYDLQVEAVRVIQANLSSRDERIRFRAAKALLYDEPKILRKIGDGDTAGDGSGVPSIRYDYSKADPELTKGLQ